VNDVAALPKAVLAKLKVGLLPPVPKGADEAAGTANTGEAAAGPATAGTTAAGDATTVVGADSTAMTFSKPALSSAGALVSLSWAACSAVRPLFVVTKGSAPALSSSGTQSSQPHDAAKIRGVTPALVFASTSAPALSNGGISSQRPHLAAQCKELIVF